MKGTTTKKLNDTLHEDSMKIDKILQLAEEFIVIQSTINKPSEVKKILALSKEQLKEFTVESFSDHRVPSLLIHNAAAGTKKFKIILTSHLDVVAGKPKQFVPTIKDGKLYGRGSYDMKAATAVMIFLFKNLAHQLPYPIALQIATDEENGGFNGAKYQVDKGVRGEFIIAGECGSNFKIVHQAKGMLRTKIIAQGKTSHSAYPWRGDNAILKLHSAIHAILQKYPLPKEEAYETTVNVTHVQTNNHPTQTVTPDLCEAILDIRVIPKDAHSVIDTIESVLPDGVTSEVIYRTAPPQTDPGNKYIKLLSKAAENVLQKEIHLAKAHGTSDMRHFTEVGCDGVEFGPIGNAQHHDREWVDIKSLEDYYLILKDFLLSIK